MKRAKEFLEGIFKVIKREEMRILPGQLAFFIVFSLLTIFSLIGLIGSNFITKELIMGMEDTLPSAISTILKSILEKDVTDFNMIVFVLFSLYIASNGCGSMIITSNALYKIKNDNIIKQKVKAFIMTIILIILILFIVLVPAFGELIIDTLQNHYPGRLIETISQIYTWCRLPLSFVMIFVGVKILYTMAPDKRISSRYTNYGALFTTILWIVITKLYSVYLNNINTYNIFYGSLANIVILLFWVYLLAYVFTLGIALNMEHYYDSQDV